MWRQALAVLGCALTLGACTTAHSGAPATTHSGASVTVPAAASLSGPSRAPVGNSGVFPIDATFTSSRHGWVLATPDSCASRCLLFVERTVDGGRTWHRMRSDTPLPGPSGQPKIFFADDRNGWILNGRLWSTHDGGRSWHAVALPDKVAGLAANGPNQPVLLATNGRHGPALLRSAPDVDHWVVGGAIPAASKGNLRLSRDGDHVYVVRYDETGDGSSLVVSSDGGASFHRRTDPCGAFSFSESVTRGPDGSLWFLCGSEGGAGDQHKKAYVSTNDGLSWAALPKLTDGGYPNFMTFGSASRGLLMLSRSPLLLTGDRGRHWRAVVSRDEDGFFTAGGWFGDMAYALTTRAVWITNDAGRHWREHRFGPR